ncbi:acetyl-CoA acetyltransferase [Nocardia sp. SYP-A9097]|uniref:thiolase family protein n=1 Tax=Nocardia sp. SYP-A9097 TaxID=2663237 RepID=UPI00129B0DA4|nr:acetyl-CoA acetyltransferase [Nocardia sp. SYP-A9097]MRH86399.1 acetyl-CoA acetyltransferase [Nocardia sp. SYP-A9097]
MRRAAIVMPMRTPVGLPGGALAAVTPQRLVSTVLSAVVGRSGIDPYRIEQLVTAVSDHRAVRAAIPLSGLPPSIGEFPIGGGPGGGLRALITAAMMVQTGAADVVLAVGAEFPGAPAQSGESGPHGPGQRGRGPLGAGPLPDGPRGGAPVGGGPAFGGITLAGLRNSGPFANGQQLGADTGEQLAVWAAAESMRGAGESKYAELLAQHYGISRRDADEFAAASHRRAARARRQGIFGAETAPVVVNAVPEDANSGVVQLVDRDEGLRDDVSPRAFAVLEPFLPGGVTTVGNSSTRTLAASGCLVVAEDRLVDLGLEPMGYLVGWASATGELESAVPAAGQAIAKSLARSGFELDEVDLLEIDESSAVEVLALTRLWEREGWEFDPAERLNVHGAAIALGDPGGAAGLRMVTTLLHELARREGGYGLAAIPTGPSEALAAVFESAYTEQMAPTPRGARFHGARPPRRFGRHRSGS